MKKLLVISILVLSIAATAMAQQNGRTKFASDMYQAKHEMIIQEL